MTIANWLEHATHLLSAANINSSRLDAEVLLADVLHKNRTYLHAHGEALLSKQHYKTAESHLQLRLQRVPLAYIRGYKEFFGREFYINPSVLIPRPETETLVEVLLALPHQPGDKLLDVGTGCGTIAVTVALELPTCEVHARDISPAALTIAQKNAKKLGAKVIFTQQDLLHHESARQLSIIAANLPYVDITWHRSPETTFEPSLAIFAGDGGLELITKLIRQSPKHLKPRGYLLLEADPRQHVSITSFANSFGYTQVVQKDFILALQLTN